MGCLACALNCPTNYIKFKELGHTREIWDRKFELLRDEKTGATTITKEFAEYLVAHRNINPEYFRVNDESHRKELALGMGKIAQWSREESK